MRPNKTLRACYDCDLSHCGGREKLELAAGVRAQQPPPIWVWQSPAVDQAALIRERLVVDFFRLIDHNVAASLGEGERDAQQLP